MTEQIQQQVPVLHRYRVKVIVGSSPSVTHKTMAPTPADAVIKAIRGHKDSDGEMKISVKPE